MKPRLFTTLIITVFFFLAGLAPAQFLHAQCYKPKPMTTSQTETVKGVWKGIYQYAGTSTAITIHIYTDGDARLICDIDVPPVEGKPDDHLYWFCDGGEFHLKKFISNKTYSFQGTPVNGNIEGLMVIKENDKTVVNGKFRVSKVQ
jgi:hypothetical protein